MTIKAVILGATGYVGAELLRLIAGHPSLAFGAAVDHREDVHPLLVAGRLDLGVGDLGILLEKSERDFVSL